MSGFIPYGGYWSTPFSRWQGSFAHLHSLSFAATVCKQFLTNRNIDDTGFDGGILGTTVPQKSSFYGLPWVASMAGIQHLAGPTISQACATSARCLQMASDEVSIGRSNQLLIITADRTSNGPNIYYPKPEGPGGTGDTENWVLDNFSRDPWSHCAMVDTAENVAREIDISTDEQHELVLFRLEQYRMALADNGRFQRRYMPLPFDVNNARGEVIGQLETDEGIYPTTAEKLAKLKPVKKCGSVTFGSQTHPADGNAGMIVTTKQRARDLSTNPDIEVEVVAFGQSRERPAYMPTAPIAASRLALGEANLKIADIHAIKSHNPFAVNDIAFARHFGIDWRSMNNFGCSLIWGHPQGPTGLRAMIELIEELVMRGGGFGLFQGCAAGDSSIAVVLKVTDTKSHSGKAGDKK